LVLVVVGTVVATLVLLVAVGVDAVGEVVGFVAILVNVSVVDVSRPRLWASPMPRRAPPLRAGRGGCHPAP
jgi:hypothetical protein